MKIFKPYMCVDSVTELTPEMLRDIGVDGIVADLDNTLALPDDPMPTEKVHKWLNYIRLSGIPVSVVSNSRRIRVEKFCKPLGLDYVCRAGKPLGFGLKIAAKKMGIPVKRTVLVGDQLFTDVLGARAAGMRCILVKPLVDEPGPFFRFKRAMERKIRKTEDI